MTRFRPILGTVAITAAVALALPSNAHASPAPSDPIVSGLAGPLQIDVNHRGQVYVGQAFAGILTKVRTGGSTKDLAFEQGGVEGVASRRHNVAYTVYNPEAADPVALLKVRKASGKVRTVADFWKYEEKNNPDGDTLYGFRNLSPRCAKRVPPQVGGEPYPGIVDSHPYAVANGPHGGWYVADAAANGVFYVSRRGDIELVSLLKPQRTTVTADAAKALGLPKCTVGKKYAFEPVPTDVEVAKSGHLIVSLLPGGPEDESLGARGSVVRINPWTGHRTRLASGIFGATNVAVSPGGKIYVAELFGNRISRVKNGGIKPVVDVASPAGLEYARGKLYASVDVFGAGSIVTIRP